MRAKPRILVIDDERPFVFVFAIELKKLGFQVIKSYDGRNGLRKARREKPDLIILDWTMPDMSGLDVCRKVREDPDISQTPILMLTAKGQKQEITEGMRTGADDYLAKPYYLGELEVRLRALLKRSNPSPFPVNQQRCTLLLSCVPQQRISIRASGSFTGSEISDKVLNIETEVYARHGNSSGNNWQFYSQQSGQNLYQQLIGDHQEIHGMYREASGEAGEATENLHLRFEGARDFLRVPLEFLHNGTDYLVLLHALTRSIMGVNTKRKPLSPNFLNRLASKGEEIMILLIASNTYPDIPGADKEIKVLNSFLKKALTGRGYGRTSSPSLHDRQHMTS